MPESIPAGLSPEQVAAMRAANLASACDLPGMPKCKGGKARSRSKSRRKKSKAKKGGNARSRSRSRSRSKS